jgi:hypothetical protein
MNQGIKESMHGWMDGWMQGKTCLFDHHVRKQSREREREKERDRIIVIVDKKKILH